MKEPTFSTYNSHASIEAQESLKYGMEVNEMFESISFLERSLMFRCGSKAEKE